jgi:hypothetical protein
MIPLMATPARGKKRLVVDVELDSEVEVASAFSRLSVSVVAKRTGGGCGLEHTTGKELTCAATSGTSFCRQGAPPVVKELTATSVLPLLF